MIVQFNISIEEGSRFAPGCFDSLIDSEVPLSGAPEGVTGVLVAADIIDGDRAVLTVCLSGDIEFISALYDEHSFSFGRPEEG